MTHPVLFATHRPVVSRGSQPFFTAHRVPGPAGTGTPHACSGTTRSISSRTYARASPKTESGVKIRRGGVTRSTAVVRVSPQRASATVRVRPSRAFAASSPAARPTTRHSAVAASLSLRTIIASA